MKWDDIHRHCCFVSKVRRQLGILQTRQRHKLLLAGNRCLRESWHSTTILLLTEINKISTRDTPWLSSNERQTLKHTQAGWHANIIFWFYTPKTAHCGNCQLLWAKGEMQRMTTSTAFHTQESKVELNRKKMWMGSHILVVRTAHASMHTQRHTHTHSDAGCWQSVQ